MSGNFLNFLSSCKYSLWSTSKFLHGSGCKHCLFLHAPLVTCFLHAAFLKFAVGPPTSCI